MLRDLHKRLRPMGFADILDEAIDLYRRNFVLLAGIGAFLYVPLALLQLVANEPSTARVGTAAALGTYLTRMSLAGLLYLAAATFVTGALTLATSEIYLGRATSVLACYQRVARRSVFFRFIGANVLYVLGIIGAAIPAAATLAVAAAVFEPGSSDSAGRLVLGLIVLLFGLLVFAVPVYVASRCAVYTPAFFVEGMSAASSLGRSWSLLKGRVLGTFGMLLVVSLVVFLVKSIVLSPLYVLMFKAMVTGAEVNPVLSAIHTLLASALDAIMMPINSMVVILIYYDARIRKEGFDLETLAAEMDQGAREAASARQPLPHEVGPTGGEQA